MLGSRRIFRLGLALVLFASCEKADKRSGLEKRAGESSSAPAAAEATLDATKSGGGELTANENPPPGAERIRLALALPDDTQYVVQTVGNVTLPLLGAPVAFAREERIQVTGCHGAGPERQCTLKHRVSNFDAEGQPGVFLKNDEKPVLGVTATVALRADGTQPGISAFDGPAKNLASESVVALAPAHFFFCLRFPKEPVAVGATWTDECSRRMAGVVSKRHVRWEFAELEDGDNGQKLAQLRYVGKYEEPDRTQGGVRRGSIQGVFYFRAHSGEPHTLKEQISVTLDPSKGLKTVTNLNYTFGKVTSSPNEPSQGKGKDQGKGKTKTKEVFTLTNGEPFPAPVNAPAPGDKTPETPFG